MSIIPNKLKEELIDVGKVYNNGSCIISHPNSFDRLQTEIMKICNEKTNLEKQVNKAKEIIGRLMDIINHDLKCFDTIAGLDIKQKAELFLKE